MAHIIKMLTIEKIIRDGDPMNHHTEETESDRKIKDGFLRVLGHRHLDAITVTEVVSEAAVSRSTFYLRFGNLANVYEALVAEMLTEMSPIEIQIDCDNCRGTASKEGKLPFCEIVRRESRYTPLVKEDRFLSTVIHLIDPKHAGSMVHAAMSKGLTSGQANALHIFQMSGCFAASTLSGIPDDEWPETKRLIDRFICSGLEAIT